ncbi:hypothetical protein, partial [Candidatus Chlorohelix sp.]|uniref:hypothetical protein n=1 Tax=Candidatus Chlorohelix sp. TaxID=3139201 RepID=UPI003044E756
MGVAVWVGGIVAVGVSVDVGITPTAIPTARVVLRTIARGTPHTIRITNRPMEMEQPFPNTLFRLA